MKCNAADSLFARGESVRPRSIRPWSSLDFNTIVSVARDPGSQHLAEGCPLYTGVYTLCTPVYASTSLIYKHNEPGLYINTAWSENVVLYIYVTHAESITNRATRRAFWLMGLLDR